MQFSDGVKYRNHELERDSGKVHLRIVAESTRKMPTAALTLHPLHIYITKRSVNVHVAQSEPDQTHSFTKRLLPPCASSELIISTSAYQRHQPLPISSHPGARLPHLFRKIEGGSSVFKVKDNGKERRRIGQIQIRSPSRGYAELVGKLTSRLPAGRTAENFLSNDFATERQQLERSNSVRIEMLRIDDEPLLFYLFLPSFAGLIKILRNFIASEDKISSSKRDESSSCSRREQALNSIGLFEIFATSSGRIRPQRLANNAPRMIYRNRDKKFMTSRCDKEAGGCKRVVVYPSFAQNRMLQSLPSSWQNASTKITLYYPATMPPEPLKAPIPTRS